MHTFAPKARLGASFGEGLSTGVSGLLGAGAGCGDACSPAGGGVATGVTCSFGKRDPESATHVTSAM